MFQEISMFNNESTMLSLTPSSLFPFPKNYYKSRKSPILIKRNEKRKFESEKRS